MLAAAAALALGAASAAHASLLYYGGDFDPTNPNANALANEIDTLVPSGAATYDNFTVPSGTWHVTGLFTNNLTDLGSSITSANWEIRTGLSEGNGGTLLFSGSATPVVTPTGRSGFGRGEFTVEVPVSFNLGPGTYWVSVLPVAVNSGTGRSFESNTFGLNAVGIHTLNDDFFNSAFFGANFTNANNEGVFPTFSSGVLGVTSTVPEPTTWAMLILGVAMIGFAVRRREGTAAAA